MIALFSNRIVKVLGSAGLARVSTVVANLTIVWLLSQLLPGSEFGLVMLALALVLTVCAVHSSAYEKLILFHASRHGLGQVDPECDSKRRGKCGWVLISGLITGVLVAAFLFVGAEWLGGIFHKPELATWIARLSPLVPLDAIRMVSGAWFRGKHDIVRSALVQELAPNLVRVGGVSIALALDFGAMIALDFFVLGTCAGVIFAIRGLPWPRLSGGDGVGLWDVGFGVKSGLTQLVNQPGRHLDVVVIGFVLPNVAVGHFALASRLSQILPFCKQILDWLLMGRMGTALQRGAKDSLLEEYRCCSAIALATAATGLAGFAVLGPWMLSLFGEHGPAFAPLLILGVSMVLRCGFGSNGAYLTMAGYAGWNLIITISGLSAMVAGMFILVPNLELLGAAIAVLIQAIVVNIAAAYVIWRLDGLNTVGWVEVSAMSAIGMIVLGIVSLEISAGLSGFGIVLAALGVVVGRWRTMCRGISSFGKRQSKGEVAVAEVAS